MPTPKHTGVLTMAQQECANHQEGHYCSSRDGDCILRSSKRCDYFERCVLPLAEKELPRQKEYARARDRYRRVHKISFDADERRCPDCGTILPRRKRYCLKCAKKRRTDSVRQIRWKARSLDNT